MLGWWPICHAKQDGVLQFEGDVLPENKAMLAAFARCGLPMKKTLEGGGHSPRVLLPAGAGTMMDGYGFSVLNCTAAIQHHTNGGYP